MKRLLTTLAVLAVLTSCSSAASAGEPSVPEPPVMGPPAMSGSSQLALPRSFEAEPDTDLYQYVYSREYFEKQQRTAVKQENKKQKFENTLRRLKSTAGNTWYVFSGATPSGWDCSGLVTWFYGELGVTLEHSATKQLYSGEHVDQPMVGDIVAFSYPGSSRSFHVGIYIGGGKVIHAYYYGKRTVIQKVSDVQKENGGAKVTYVRIPDGPNAAEAMQ